MAWQEKFFLCRARRETGGEAPGCFCDAGPAQAAGHFSAMAAASMPDERGRHRRKNYGPGKGWNGRPRNQLYSIDYII
nr:hypothetical protein SHINE37_10318 [Rhizobiaceae bacterium]